MRVRHVDFEANVIRLDVGSTKNDERREVTMTANVRALLTECARDKKLDDFLFTRENNKRINFRRVWRSLCVAAGVGQMVCRDCAKIVAHNKCKCGSPRRLRYQGLIVHDLRRTGARNLRLAGVDRDVIMKIGGWKIDSVFRPYNIVDQRDIREAMQKLEQTRTQIVSHNLSHNSPTSDAEVVSTKTAGVN
jgi:integrase